VLTDRAVAHGVELAGYVGPVPVVADDIGLAAAAGRTRLPADLGVVQLLVAQGVGPAQAVGTDQGQTVLGAGGEVDLDPGQIEVALERPGGAGIAVTQLV